MKLVGLTAGLVNPRKLRQIGKIRNPPEIPVGELTTETASPMRKGVTGFRSMFATGKYTDTFTETAGFFRALAAIVMLMIPFLVWAAPATAQGAAGEEITIQDQNDGQTEDEAAPADQFELDEPESFEDLLARQEGEELQYQGRTYVWRDGQPFEKSEDGTLLAIEAPENLFYVDSEGLNWLSREADGTFYIEVSPRVLASINFAHNSDVIEDGSKPILDVFGNSLNSPGLIRHRLIIAGHTNNIGNPEYNLKLSRRRAASVSRYLTEQHHLDPERLILHGYGDTRPIADNETEEGQEKNRRVEFILLQPPAEEEAPAGN